MSKKSKANVLTLLLASLSVVLFAVDVYQKEVDYISYIHLVVGVLFAALFVRKFLKKDS